MKPVSIDLGSGPRKLPGVFGFDLYLREGVDVVCDLERDLPIKADAVDVMLCSHVMEHIRNFVPLMEEIYRVCRDGAEVRISVPYYTSKGAFRDPTHVRYFTEDTFQHFEPPTYGVKTDFRIEEVKFDLRKPFRWFPRYLQKRCRRYLWNVVDNMQVTLRAVKAATRGINR